METSLDGELLTVQFGRAWLDKILGLVLPLTDEQNYSPLQDQELATLYARDIVVRLMGGEIYLSGQSGSSPMTLTPISFTPQSGANVNIGATGTTNFWPNHIWCDNVESNDPWVGFSVFLTEAHTKIRLWLERDSDYGKGELTCGVSGVCEIKTFDLYAPTEVLNYWVDYDLDVPVDSWYDFVIYRRGKSVSSAGYYLVLAAVEVFR